MFCVDELCNKLSKFLNQIRLYQENAMYVQGNHKMKSDFKKRVLKTK